MEFLKLNQRLQIVYDDGSNITKSCASQIMDYDNNSMLIAEPTNKANIIDIPVGTVIEVLAIDSKCVYSFNSSVLGKQTNPPSLWLSLPETYRRIQKREYVRVNVKLPIIVNIIAETEIAERCLTSNILSGPVIAEGFFTTSSIDISGGGVKVFGPLEFKANSIVKLMIRLPMKEITTSAKVNRSELNDKISQKDFDNHEFAKYNFITAFSYKDIEDSDRSTIIQLCFKRQLELRQRGIS